MLNSIYASIFANYSTEFWGGNVRKSGPQQSSNRYGTYRANVYERLGFSQEHVAYLKVNAARRMSDESTTFNVDLWIYRGNFDIEDGVFLGGDFDELIAISSGDTKQYDSSLSPSSFKRVVYSESFEIGQWFPDPTDRDLRAYQAEVYESSYRVNADKSRTPVLAKWLPNGATGRLIYSGEDLRDWQDFVDKALVAGFPEAVLKPNFPFASDSERTSVSLDESTFAALGMSELVDFSYPPDAASFVHPEFSDMDFKVTPGRSVVGVDESIGFAITFTPLPVMATSKRMYWRIDQSIGDNGQTLADRFAGNPYGTFYTNIKGSHSLYLWYLNDLRSEFDVKDFTVSLYEDRRSDPLDPSSILWENRLASVDFQVVGRPDLVPDLLYQSGEGLDDLAARFIPGLIENQHATLEHRGWAKVDVNASSWRKQLKINRSVRGAEGDLTVLQALQASKDAFDDGPVGSIVSGTSSDDVIRGLAGWDLLSGGDGSDLIHGGNGRDILSGGSGADELHGDFGWNTYEDQRDGYADLIAIKSDHFLFNHWYSKSGNSPNGEKADVIEGLDPFDEIVIVGANSRDLSVSPNASRSDLSGVGIYAKGILEAIYVGGDLTPAQLISMLSGDDSDQAMANQMWSYRSVNSPPALI